jgi:Putative prokaryotic signal transducing protein
VSLVSVLTPDSDVELLTVCSMLEARGVPFFVSSAGLCSLFPGPMQAGSLSARAIMVPEERADEALALIADFSGSSVDIVPSDR